MKPKEFKEANVVFAKDQPEYRPLPAFADNSERGEVVVCWSLTFMERLRVLLKGEIWHSVLTFNNPLMPSSLTTKKTDFLVEQNIGTGENKQGV